MSSPAPEQVLHPTNPTLAKDTNVPRENGHTRVTADGGLLYWEPITEEEVPAVRLETIRPRLIQEASKKKSYRFPKKRGYDDTNVTAFVKKDYNYGPKRENWPDCLFQIQSNGAKGEMPNGYVMDGERIVLDAFDHGLRNFGNQLPVYVSTELEGHDVEHYLRRNREISVYDLIARAPNGYHKGMPEEKSQKTTKRNKRNKADEQEDEIEREWHEGPPRVGTFSMRATRFRLSAGLLSWEKKDGTVAKNQRILDQIPDQYKDPSVNSTKGWRDLNKNEIKAIADGAMRKPQKGPKDKRAAVMEKKKKEKERLLQESIEAEGALKDGVDVESEDEGSSFDAFNGPDNGAWPTADLYHYEGFKPAPQGYHTVPQSNDAWQAPSFVNKTPVNDGYELGGPGFPQLQKRSRNNDADSDDAGNILGSKRMRVATDAQANGHQRKGPIIRTSRMPRPQQRGQAPRRYGAKGAPSALPQPAVDGNVPGQADHPTLPGSGFHPPQPILHQDINQTMYSTNSVNAGYPIPGTDDSISQTMYPTNFVNAGYQMPGTEDSNGLPRFDGSSYESPLVLDEDFGMPHMPHPHGQPGLPSDPYVQIGPLQTDQVSSHSIRSPYLQYGKSPGFENPGLDFQGYAPQFGLGNEGPSNYVPPGYQSEDFSPSPHVQYAAPLAQPVLQIPAQQFYPTPDITGKRKRTHINTFEQLEQPEQQHPPKRVKEYTTNATSNAELHSYTATAPQAENLVPTTNFAVPSSEDEHLGMQHTDVPYAVETFPTTAPSPEMPSYIGPWIKERFPAEEEIYMPELNNQQGMVNDLFSDPGQESSYVEPWIKDLFPPEEQGYVAEPNNQQGMVDDFFSQPGPQESYVEPWIRELFPAEEQEYIPEPIHQQGMVDTFFSASGQQRDFNHVTAGFENVDGYLGFPNIDFMNQDLNNGFGDGMYPPTDDFNTGQWDAPEAAPSSGWTGGWVEELSS